jgi:hypothetical protein
MFIALGLNPGANYIGYKSRGRQILMGVVFRTAERTVGLLGRKSSDTRV